ALALAAAKSLRQPFDPGQPFQPAFPAEDVAKAKDWLNKAYTLWDSPENRAPLELRKELALAIYKGPKPNKRVADLLEELVPDGPVDDFPYLWIKAQAHPDNRSSFNSYDALWKLLPADAKVTPVERYTKILLPVLTKGEAFLNEEVSEDVA